MLYWLGREVKNKKQKSKKELCEIKWCGGAIIIQEIFSGPASNFFSVLFSFEGNNLQGNRPFMMGAQLV